MSQLNDLRDEKEKIGVRLEKALKEKERLEHKLRQTENRADYLMQGKRAKRTHRLCVKGAVVESLVPDLTDFSEREFYDLMEQVFSLPQVESLVQGKINHRKQEEENG